MTINISDPMTNLLISIAYIIISILFGYLAKMIGRKKYFGNTFFIGFFLHTIGIIILLITPKKTKESLIKHYNDSLTNKIITKKQYDIRMSKIK